jgi:hypothetical protein
MQIHAIGAPLHLHKISARELVEQSSRLLSLLQVSAGPRDKEGWAKRFREASPDCGCCAGCNRALAGHMA